MELRPHGWMVLSGWYGFHRHTRALFRFGTSTHRLYTRDEVFRRFMPAGLFALRLDRMRLRLLGIVTNVVPHRFTVCELVELVANYRIIIKTICSNRKGIEL